MLAISLVAPMLLAVPVRDIPAAPPAKTSWVGKTVFVKSNGLSLDPGAEPNDANPMPGGIPVTAITYKVYGERPNHVQVRTREGTSGWLKKSDAVLLDDAVLYFSKLIEANPKDATLYSRRAAAWRSKGELDAAIKDASEALRLNPNAAYYNNRALIWHAKKDYDKALADYSQALTMNPRYTLVFVNRATMWHAMKDYDKAIADTTQAIGFDAKYPAAYRIRGISFHGKKEYDKAIADLSRALEIDPKSAQTRADRGNAWAGKKEHEKARDDFNEAVRLEPTNAVTCAMAAFWLASCPEEKLRDGKRALDIAQKAYAEERSNPRVIEALAAACAEVGRFEEAIRLQERALADPQLQNNNEVRNRLECYRKKQPYRRD
jgi:tetratricopeptide (TPR) repeat protein